MSLGLFSLIGIAYFIILTVFFNQIPVCISFVFINTFLAANHVRGTRKSEEMKFQTQIKVYFEHECEKMI
jgi:hypothetical protein